MDKIAFNETEVYLIHEIVIRLDRRARVNILEPLEIVYPEFLVLMSVQEMNAPTQEEVGSYIDMSSSSISQRVRSLRKKGFITQTQNQDNRRKVFLSLTATGKEILDKAYNEMETGSNELFDVVGSRRELFRQALHAIVEELRAQERPEST